MKRWIFLALIIGAGAAAYYGKHSPESAPPPPSAPSAVSVVSTQVVSRDVPLWLSGIGTVQGYNTVVVRPRVGGILEKIEFTEGSLVEKGTVLAQIDPRPYEAALALAVARKAQNEAQLVSAKQDQARMESLFQSRSVSQQAWEQATALVAQLEAAIEADSAAIASARLELDYATVRAPISGRAGLRLLDEGNLVTANQSEGLVHITQLQPVSVIFTLPQQHLPALRSQTQPGTPPTLVVEAMDERGEKLGEGQLELIDNQIDLSTGTLRLKARFANESLTLWPGQFVTARVLVDTRENSKVVPNEVVQPGLEGPFAYLIREDNTVEARRIVVGPSLDGWTIIEAGLESGDEVVREGQSKLKPGSLIVRRELQPELRAHR